MKPRWKIAIALAAFAALCAFFLFRSDTRAQKALEETRRALH
jgi:HAMP domain-containing protein